MNEPQQDLKSKANCLGNQLSNEKIEEYIIEDSSDESETELPEVKVGLIAAALELLQKKSTLNQINLKPTICSLLIGEISLNLKPETYKGKVFGYTEGIGKRPLPDAKKLASKAVIFMVVSLTENWKIPVGIYFAHNPDIKCFAETIQDALKKLDAIGVEIVSITLNCISPHLSFALADQLGAEIDSSKPLKSLRPYFAHPSTDNLVHILYDLDSILLFLKRFWAVERVLSYKKQVLGYSLCTHVKTIEGVDFENQRNKFDWIIIKKRLTYDAENIGKTLADAMEYLKDANHPDFKESGPVIKFIRVLELIAQISKVNGKIDGIFLNLSKSNEQEWKSLVLNIIHYIKGLKHFSGDTPKHLSVFRIYTTGIIVYFTSLLKLYEKYVNYFDERLPFLLPSKFALKHIALGVFTNKPDTMTALSVFKTIQSNTETLMVTDF